VGIEPTAVVLSPDDYVGVDLLRDGMERYCAGPFGAGPATLWGLPRAIGYQLAPGEALIGDFRKYTLWDREQASISFSDSHADFFTRNLVAILAEVAAWARCATCSPSCATR
jgi:HK97 family phage major capsid protein